MSAGWSLLKSLADWDEYRRRIADDYGLPVADVQWGTGPKQYPCLVASYRVTSHKVIGCYAYLEDAQWLAQAAGLAVSPPAPPGMVAIPQSQLPPAQAAELTETLAHMREMLAKVSALHQSYKEFYRYASANHLTVADIFVNEFRGYITPQRYEAGFAKFLAFVDQHGEDKAGQCLLEAKAILEQIKATE